MKCSPIEDITPVNTILDFDFYSENSIDSSEKSETSTNCKNSQNYKNFDSNSLNSDTHSLDSTLFDSIPTNQIPNNQIPNNQILNNSSDQKYCLLSPVTEPQDPEPAIQFSVVKEENSPSESKNSVKNSPAFQKTSSPNSLPKNNATRKRHLKRSSSPRPRPRNSSRRRKYRIQKTISGIMDLRELVTISKNKMNLLGSAPQVVNNFSTDIRKAVLISRMLNSIGTAMGNDYIYQDQYYDQFVRPTQQAVRMTSDQMNEITSMILSNTQQQLSNYHVPKQNELPPLILHEEQPSSNSTSSTPHSISSAPVVYQSNMGTTVTLTSNLYEEHQPVQLQPLTNSSNDYSIFEDNSFTKETYQPFSSMCDISGDLTSLDAETMFNDSENVLTIDTDTFSSANRGNGTLEYIPSVNSFTKSVDELTATLGPSEAHCDIPAIIPPSSNTGNPKKRTKTESESTDLAIEEDLEHSEEDDEDDENYKESSPSKRSKSSDDSKEDSCTVKVV